MTQTTHDDKQEPSGPDELIMPVLSDLEAVVAKVTPDQFDLPTPCPDFDVADLRSHVLGWVNYFGIALNDPAGEADRPDPKAYQAPADPKEGAAVVREAAAKIATAVDGGVAEGPVKLVQASMPGDGAITMMLWECLVHGNDLATATGQKWQPADQAATTVLAFGENMLTDEYRGPGKDFGTIVEVPDAASPMDRLIGFSGRDPHWTPPAA